MFEISRRINNQNSGYAVAEQCETKQLILNEMGYFLHKG